MKTFEFIKAYMKAFMTGVGYAGIIILCTLSVAGVILLIRELVLRLFA